MSEHHTTHVIYTEITEKELSLTELVSRVEDPASGAIASFTGVTRNNFGGKEVLRLEYEAYKPMADKKLKASAQEQESGSSITNKSSENDRENLQEICETARLKYDITKVAISHRIGVVLVGEASVIIAVSSAHRRAALEACAWAIDELKAKVPIWKKEFFSDGSIWKENTEFRGANISSNSS